MTTKEAVLVMEGRELVASGQLAVRRQKARLSQVEFAEIIGVSSAAVSRWEAQPKPKRTPRREQAKRIALVFRQLERAA